MGRKIIFIKILTALLISFLLWAAPAQAQEGSVDLSNVTFNSLPAYGEDGDIASVSDFAEEMVRVQLLARGIDNEEVLQAIRETPRHQFVSVGSLHERYGDFPLSIGYEQTISQPFMVGYMTNLLQVKSGFKVLEIGTGSGYQAAVLSEIVSKTYTIEIITELYESASKRLKNFGYENVICKNADGYFGWEEFAPFDAIVVTAAAEYIPPPLIEQLKDGGKMIIPVGSPFLNQSLILVEKDGEEITTTNLLPVRFVPFTRGD